MELCSLIGLIAWPKWSPITRSCGAGLCSSNWLCTVVSWTCGFPSRYMNLSTIFCQGFSCCTEVPRGRTWNIKYEYLLLFLLKTTCKLFPVASHHFRMRWCRWITSVGESKKFARSQGKEHRGLTCLNTKSQTAWKVVFGTAGLHSSQTSKKRQRL